MRQGFALIHAKIFSLSLDRLRKILILNSFDLAVQLRGRSQALFGSSTFAGCKV
jgi:hypothetical protein